MMVMAAASVLMGAEAPFAEDLPPMNHVVLLGDSVFDNE
jgi:hypothetical protein